MSYTKAQILNTWVQILDLFICQLCYLTRLSFSIYNLRAEVRSCWRGYLAEMSVNHLIQRYCKLDYQCSFSFILLGTFSLKRTCCFPFLMNFLKTFEQHSQLYYEDIWGFVLDEDVNICVFLQLISIFSSFTFPLETE